MNLTSRDHVRQWEGWSIPGVESLHDSASEHPATLSDRPIVIRASLDWQPFPIMRCLRRALPFQAQRFLVLAAWRRLCWFTIVHFTLGNRTIPYHSSQASTYRPQFSN